MLSQTHAGQLLTFTGKEKDDSVSELTPPKKNNVWKVDEQRWSVRTCKTMDTALKMTRKNCVLERARRSVACLNGEKNIREF